MIDYSTEKMFFLESHFKEIGNDPEYFLNEKQGLKSLVIDLNPYLYMEAVNLVKKEHKISSIKLESLKDAYDSGIKVPMPYLYYGDRDEISESFGQEGYNRAYTATMIGKETIPVSIRYRDNDVNIPDFIKKAIHIKKLENEAFKIGFEAINYAETPNHMSALMNVKFKDFLFKNNASISNFTDSMTDEERDNILDLDILLSKAFVFGVEEYRNSFKNKTTEKNNLEKGNTMQKTEFNGLNKEDLEFLGFKKSRTLSFGDEYQIESSAETISKLTELGFGKTWGHEGLTTSYATFRCDNDLCEEDYGKNFISVRECESAETILAVKNKDDSTSESKKLRRNR